MVKAGHVDGIRIFCTEICLGTVCLELYVGEKELSHMGKTTDILIRCARNYCPASQE